MLNFDRIRENYFVFSKRDILYSEKIPLLSAALLKCMMTHRIVTSLSLGLQLGDNTER